MNPRHDRARSAARRQAEAFFRESPDRLFWARPSIPFEREGWRDGDHSRWPVVIVARPDCNTLRHAALPVACDLVRLPNDDDFLGKVWRHLTYVADDASRGDERIVLTPELTGSFLPSKRLDRI